MACRMGKIFFFFPMCLYSNAQIFVENSNLGEEHEKKIRPLAAGPSICHVSPVTRGGGGGVAGGGGNTGNTVSVSQFRENVNVAAKGPSAKTEMSRVCDALSQCWNLPVHCDCLSRGDVCNGSCVRQSLRILGVTMHAGSSVVCFSTPSALNDTWQLKWGPSLHSPWAVSAGHLSNIFTGSLVNSLPFNFSWACLLLSISAWMQLACLCDHTRATVLCAMKGAIHRVCSRGPWCVDATISWAVLQAHHLPTTPRCTAGLLQTWLKREAFWHDGMYVSWHAPHGGDCSATCAPWDADFDVLAYI